MSPAAKTVCVVLILLLTQLDCIASRPLPRALRMSDLQNHQISIEQTQPVESSNPLKKDEPMETGEIWNGNKLQPTGNRSPEPDAVIWTMHPRSVITPVSLTEITNVPVNHEKEHARWLREQTLLYKYFKTLREDKDIENYLICFGSLGLPYEILDKFKRRPYKDTPTPLCPKIL